MFEPPWLVAADGRSSRDFMWFAAAFAHAPLVYTVAFATELHFLLLLRPDDACVELQHAGRTSCCLSDTQISPSFRLSWMTTNSRFELTVSTSSAYGRIPHCYPALVS